jgi:hypothetical protein
VPVDPRTERVEVTRPRLFGNRAQRSGVDSVVHRHAHHPDVVVVGRVFVPEFDVTTRPVDDENRFFVSALTTSRPEKSLDGIDTTA